MAEGDPGLKFNGVLLREGQVMSGMTVAIALEGKGSLEVGKDGKPLIFRALVGGVNPLRTKLYSARPDGELQGRDSLEFGNFKPEVRFMPTEVFSPANAQAEREYYILRKGEYVHYPEPYAKELVRVLADERGRLVSHNGFAYSYWQRDYSVPEDAVLIPVSQPKPLKPAVA